MTAPLPRGLYKHGRKYRARLPGSPWSYFGSDYATAVRRYGAWRLAGSPPDSAVPSAAAVMRTLRKNARTRNLDVTITVDDVQALLDAAGGRCTLTGLPFNAWKEDGLRMRPWYPSVDRIDRTKGYESGNCRIVCAYANLAINEFGEVAFTRLARAFLRQNRPKLGLFVGPFNQAR